MFVSITPDVDHPQVPVFNHAREHEALRWIQPFVAQLNYRL